MSKTLLWVKVPDRPKRLLHTIGAGSRYNSTPTLDRLDLRSKQKEQAAILTEAWRRSGYFPASAQFEVDASQWEKGVSG